MKKNKNEELFNDIKNKISNYNLKSKNLRNDIQKISLLFSNSIYCKDANNENIKKLFDICVDKLENDEIVFFIEVFNKNFYKAMKNKIPLAKYPLFYISDLIF